MLVLTPLSSGKHKEDCVFLRYVLLSAWSLLLNIGDDSVLKYEETFL